MAYIYSKSEQFNCCYLSVMSKFGTSVFNKVVRWHESGEVKYGYIAYNFSYFAIYLPKVIKIG